MKDETNLSEAVKELLIYYSNGNPDGYGFAYLNDRIKIFKSKHPAFRELITNNKQIFVKTNSVIGHTRYATRGKICRANSHPFISEDNSTVLVHNGWISDYKRLKKRLVMEGHKFRSKDVDSEILLHLFEDFGPNFLIKHTNLANNSYINIIIMTDDGTIYGISDGALYLTKIENYGYMLSTTGEVGEDAEAIEQGQMVILKDGVIVERREAFKMKHKTYPLSFYGEFSYRQDPWEKELNALQKEWEYEERNAKYPKKHTKYTESSDDWAEYEDWMEYERKRAQRG